MRSCLLATLVSAAGMVAAPAQEMQGPRLLHSEIDWDTARTALDRIDQLREAPDEVALLNKSTGGFFRNIAASPVPVLLPFDTAAYLHDYANATQTTLQPLDSYLTGFHLSPFFLAGPAGYDAVFNAFAHEMPDLGSAFPYRIDIQLSGAAFVYDLGEPTGMIEWPVEGLADEYPGIRRVFLENYVRYVFTRYGAIYVVSIECFDGGSRYRKISCRDADKVAIRFLKALHIAGGTPHAGAPDGEPKTIERPEAISSLFTYHSPGALMHGTGTHGLSGRPDRTVYARIRFPLGDAPAFANSQIFHGHGEADPSNYSYPWQDDFCERRSFYVGQCPGGLGHQGQDIRPASCRQHFPGGRCEPYQHNVVAVRDGTIMRAPGQQAVYLAFNGPNERLRVRYLHMLPRQLDFDGVLSGRRVHEGEFIGKVGNFGGGEGSTTYHLHFDLQVPSKYGWVFVNPYMTLVAAYERLIRARGVEINDLPLVPIGPAAAGPAAVANTIITTGSVPPVARTVHASRAVHAIVRPIHPKRNRRHREDDDDDDDDDD